MRANDVAAVMPTLPPNHEPCPNRVVKPWRLSRSAPCSAVPPVVAFVSWGSREGYLESATHERKVSLTATKAPSYLGRRDPVLPTVQLPRG